MIILGDSNAEDLRLA